MRRKQHSERDQFEFSQVLSADPVLQDTQDLIGHLFFSLAKIERIVGVDFRAGAIAIWVEAVPEHGIAHAHRPRLANGCRFLLQGTAA